MKYLLLWLMIQLTAVAEVALMPGVTAACATREEAIKVLTAKDVFIEAMSPFDRAARLESGKPVDVDQFLKMVGEQTVEWNAVERANAEQALALITNQLTGLKFTLPARIWLIKTTGKEEGGAAYCRGNAIVLPQKLINRPEPLAKLLRHELFHLVSRHNPALRDALYGVLGFKRCVVVLPEPLRQRKITNPDAPVNEHRLEVKQGGKSVSVIPVLFSENDYDPLVSRSFFAYLKFKLLVVEEKGGRWSAVEEKGQLKLLGEEEAEGFFDQIGRNTDYTIHPEEILADNFVIMLERTAAPKTPRIPAEMRRLCAAGK